MVDSVLARLRRVRRLLSAVPRVDYFLNRYRELLRFGVVGAITYGIDTAIFYGLKLTILAPKPVTAKVLAVVVATVVSYVLNREWSFRTRGGRRRHHEATLYFAVSGIGVVLYAAPLWVSRYVLHLQTPETSRLVEEIADFTSGQVIGLLAGMAFRWWAFRKWVFPDEFAPRERAAPDERPEDALVSGGTLTSRR